MQRILHSFYKFIQWKFEGRKNNIPPESHISDRVTVCLFIPLHYNKHCRRYDSLDSTNIFDLGS
jgi:hypothetical protein